MTKTATLCLTLASVLALVAPACSDGAAPAAGGAGSAGAGGGGGAAGGGGAGPLTFETFGTNLFGADGAYEAERRPAIVSAVAASDADVLCLTDVLREEDKVALAEAAKGAFPYAFWVKHGPADLASDTTREDGTTPAPATTPPCTTSSQKSALEAGVACAEMQCSSIPSDPSGHVSKLDCVTSQCGAPLLPLIAGSPEDRRCGSCFEANLTSYKSWSEITSRCEGEVSAGLVFDGQSDVLLLSRRPLSGGESFVLPSSFFRREILRARHPSGLDVYCLHLQTVFHGPLIVYPGPYAPGLSGQAAWASENHVHASKLLAFVKSKGAGPAVLLGNFESSRAATADGMEIVSANGGEGALALLTPSPFTVAVAPAYVPACTECPDNPLAQIAAPGTWTQNLLLAGLPPTVVLATQRGFLTERVTVTTANGPAMVPLSSHWSLRSVIAPP